MSNNRAVRRTGRGLRVRRAAVVRCSAGFTLIESLMAMVILSVGLLSMMPLGASGLSMVAFAEKRTERTVTAATHLERSVLQLQRTRALADTAWTLPNGDKIERTVDRSQEQKLWTVTLRLTPAAAHQGGQTTSLSSHVFIP